MKPALLKNRIQHRLWEVAAADDAILSATLTGSFLDEGSFEGVSDIDFVVVVDRLNSTRFERLVSAFDRALRGELAELGYDLRINPTLGPLKFNDPATAVLHLMLYSREAHVDHAIASPFTCFDWQRSSTHCKRSLAEVFPVFNLQPHHFMSSRRSVRDYLRDFEAGVVSYRELDCAADGYTERGRTKPMTLRDRHEFAYHILRFLMQNLVKLVRRGNLALQGEQLLVEYFSIFPEREVETRRFYDQLQTKKRARDFAQPLTGLEKRLQAFIDDFERQFRQMFFTGASRHVAFRHAPTALNHGAAGDRVFLGRLDPQLESTTDATWQSLAGQLTGLSFSRTHVSPLARCRESLAELGRRTSLPEAACDDRLLEIDYGRLDGATVSAARRSHPDLFAAWQRGEDPKFPGGECTADVSRRALAFAAEHWTSKSGNSLTCTHNVVLRTLVGHVLGLSPADWHRLEVPHLAPITFTATADHGLFVDVPAEVARTMFRSFDTLAKAA